MWSKYQEAIFAALKGSENILVNATAGSGKTTTIVESARREGKGGLLCSFGKDIAENLGRKVGAGNDSATINAIGNRILRANVRGRIVISKWKDINLVKRVAGEVGAKEVGYSISRCVSLMKNFLVGFEESGGIIKRFGIEIHKDWGGGRFEEVLEKVWRESTSGMGELSFDDQKYLPVVRGWEIRDKWRNVFIDEAQDLSPLEVKLISGFGERLVFVGDRWQSIYAFKGAMPGAMEEIGKEFGCVERGLNVCYRCCDSVIREARGVDAGIEILSVGDLGGVRREGWVGEIDREEWEKEASGGDFVICRTTAPLIKECLKMLPYKKCFVKGREIGEGLVRFIELVEGSRRGGDFLEAMEEYYVVMREQLERMGRDVALGELEDRVDSIRAICDVRGVKGAEGLIKIIEEIIPLGEGGEGVCFMTGHKSKGLETGRVWVLQRELIPHKRARQDFELEQERNLRFVIITRAQDSLGYING